MSRTNTSICITVADRERMRLIEQSNRINAIEAVSVLIDGWELLTPEQRRQAIERHPNPAAITTPPSAASAPTPPTSGTTSTASGQQAA